MPLSESEQDPFKYFETMYSSEIRWTRTHTQESEEKKSPTFFLLVKSLMQQCNLLQMNVGSMFHIVKREGKIKPCVLIRIPSGHSLKAKEAFSVDEKNWIFQWRAHSL